VPYVESCVDHGIASDTKQDLAKRLEEVFKTDADVVITTGGASVGDHDHVQDVLESLGVEIDFWKIAIRPGKPIMFGRKGKTLVFGLPGNPVSAMVTAIVAVLPALRALGGHPEPLGTCMRLPLSAPLPANGPRRHFIRAVVSAKGDGISAVRPSKETDSSHLSSLANANALIIHMENAGELPAGHIVDVILL
jgi:molybdopterin molybdotransferase